MCLAFLLPALATASLRGRCSSVLDCSLNGECADGRCSCDAQWAGSPHCDVLAFDATSRQNGYHNESFASWGGNAIFEDGKYHLFVAQFVNHCGLGQWGSASSIVRAVSDMPTGPYVFQETVIPAQAHNPTIRKIPNGGGFALYMIGAGEGGHSPNCSDPDSVAAGEAEILSGAIHVSSAPSIYGPWSAREAVQFANSSDQLYGGWVNPTPHFDADGTIYLGFQAQPEHLPWTHSGGALVGIAKGTSLAGPFTYLSPDPVTADKIWCIGGQDEDPFLWRSPRGFHIITHGMCPAGIYQAHYKFSLDGVTWHTSPKQTYRYGVKFDDGKKVNYPRVERPQLIFATTHADGAVSDPIALVNAVCDDGPNYLAAFNKCNFKQWGKTFTLVRPLKQVGVTV